MSSPATGSAITVALVDDYDVVLTGVATMLYPYRDRVVVAEIDSKRVRGGRCGHRALRLLRPARVRPRRDRASGPEWQALRVVVYTWNFHPDLIDSARRQGAHGYLSKTLSARELVAALEAVHAGEVVISSPPPRARSTVGLDWPGRSEGLTDREAEILALITQGKSNAEVATLTFLSPNTIKSYIRTIYRKIAVTSRTQAVLGGVNNGFTPDHHRIDHWRGGP